jgi:transposase InsO family protein
MHVWKALSRRSLCEEVYLHQYRTFEEAQARLQTFLEEVYHPKRLHSSLEYVPPDEFELQYALC